jgi:hypothetical protein
LTNTKIVKAFLTNKIVIVNKKLYLKTTEVSELACDGCSFDDGKYCSLWGKFICRDEHNNYILKRVVYDQYRKS